MEVGWGIFLLALKWVFAGLIYFVLFQVVMAVRREMRQRLAEVPHVEAAAPGKLRLLNGGSDPSLQPGSIIRLQAVTTLGAGRENDVVLGDHFVSNRHARLRWDGAQWWVEDLGSKNGTSISGRPAPPHREQPFAPGDTLNIGDMVFELVR